MAEQSNSQRSDQVEEDRCPSAFIQPQWTLVQSSTRIHPTQSHLQVRNSIPREDISNPIQAFLMTPNLLLTSDRAPKGLRSPRLFSRLYNLYTMCIALLDHPKIPSHHLISKRHLLRLAVEIMAFSQLSLRKVLLIASRSHQILSERITWPRNQ